MQSSRMRSPGGPGSRGTHCHCPGYRRWWVMRPFSGATAAGACRHGRSADTGTGSLTVPTPTCPCGWAAHCRRAFSSPIKQNLRQRTVASATALLCLILRSSGALTVTMGRRRCTGMFCMRWPRGLVQSRTLDHLDTGEVSKQCSLIPALCPQWDVIPLLSSLGMAHPHACMDL